MTEHNDMPDTLYHYTSMAGFKGIIESGTIWASDLLFLNDSSEFKYAFDLAKIMVANKSKKSAVPVGISQIERQFFDPNNILLDRLNESLDVICRSTEWFRTYVVSFTGLGNDLSQWRGYCPNGGVSIGFDRIKLYNHLYDVGIPLQPCEYNEKFQNEQIELILSRLHESFGKEIENLKPIYHVNNLEQAQKIAAEITQKFLREVIEIAPTYKHGSFKREEEWRAYISTSPNNKEKFNCKETYMVPYIPIPIRDENQELLVSEIMIGPTTHKDLAKISVERFLIANDIDINKCPVVDSGIPYRVSS